MNLISSYLILKQGICSFSVQLFTKHTQCFKNQERVKEMNYNQLIIGGERPS